MLICASAPSFAVLATGRVVTGLAVGAMTSALSLLVQEYSSAKRRIDRFPVREEHDTIARTVVVLLYSVTLFGFYWVST